MKRSCSARLGTLVGLLSVFSKPRLQGQCNVRVEETILADRQSTFAARMARGLLLTGCDRASIIERLLHNLGLARLTELDLGREQRRAKQLMQSNRVRWNAGY